MSVDAGHEFARGMILGPRTCNTCGEWLPDTYWSTDECFERVIQGDNGELDTTANLTHELLKYCSTDCFDDAAHGVLAFLNEHGLAFEGEGPGLEPVTACAKCGIPILRLVEHSAVSLLRLEQDNHVTEEQVLCVLCPACGGFYGGDGGDDPGGEPVVPMPTLLAA